MRRPIVLQKGETLVEGLIAMLLFSVGILALVGLQVVAIHGSRDAGYRATASQLATGIIGQMWADRSNLATYANYPSGSACAPSGSASSNSNVTTWLAGVAAQLPGAPATKQQITVGANNLVTVTVCWQAPQDTQPHSFVMSAQING